MSLYDESNELPPKKPQTQPWTPGINFLESHLRTKKASGGSTKSAKTHSTLAPVIDLQTRNKSILKRTAKKSFFLDPEYDWGYENEYDPAHFCNYYKVHEELEEWRATNEQERRKAKKIEEDRRSVSPAASLKQERVCKNFLSNYGYSDSDDCGSGDEKDPNETSSQRKRGAEFAPPASLMESTQPQLDLNSPATSTRSGEEVAAKIMAKYGFKGGHGLGKDEQGMSTALQVERTVRNCGRILHEKDLIQRAKTVDPVENQSLTDLLKNPSKVILLSNVVGPGEVDNELESEIRDECNTKYGEVVRVVIYEREKVVDDEAVRVFVEFKRAEVAIKALVDLNGRYFGGRTIRAQFYNLDRYMDYQLND